MSKFAATTSVPVEKTRAEIEKTVRRYGADSYVSGWQDRQAMVQFRCKTRVVKFVMTLPDPKAKEFTMMTTRCQARSESSANALWEQSCRSKWRALALVIKAKLEAVDSGIVEFDQEFFGHIVLPEGGTVYEHARGNFELALGTRSMQPLLEGPR